MEVFASTYALPLLAALVLLPALAAVLSLAIPQKAFRNALVILTTVVMISASSFLAYAIVQAAGKFPIEISEHATETITWIIRGIDAIVLIYVIWRGIQSKRAVAPILAVIQIASLVCFELFFHITEPATPITLDYLSLVLILLASIIGPLILVFGIGYMDSHEEHLHLTKSRQPRFFAILFLFLGVMNALAMSDNILWMYTFWEVTTLCSFLLIGHDGTEISIKNAFRTLDLNMLGGVAFIWGIIAIYHAQSTILISDIVKLHIGPGLEWTFAVGIAMLCLAGFTKAAQFPFQSWLLGAMVAPTPVSALLHSSTMVKAGVFLIVRLSPVFASTLLGNVVAFAGGFTFLAASAIAISQSNGKRVLAYSTIANLGLIICCAGIGTQAALGAAILLIIFHAVSKGLLFLCIGTIEEKIGSRDIEDMQGLMKIMPYTTFITVFGMMSMLLPPFGVLMTKWLAIEASVYLPPVLLLIILGSAFTVVFWAKWIGIILTMSYKPSYPVEKLKPSMSFTLGALLAIVLAASFGFAPMYNTLIKPHLDSLQDISKSLVLQADPSGIYLNSNGFMSGEVMSSFLFGILFLLVLGVPYFFYRTRPETVKPPYFGGELANADIRGIDFIGPGDKVEQIIVHNYYMASIFGEGALTLWTSLIAGAIILVMFGVVL